MPHRVMTNRALAQGDGAFEAADRFVYTLKPTANRELTLILTRTGLTWRLTNVLLPVET